MVSIIGAMRGRTYWKKQVRRDKEAGCKRFIFTGNYFGNEIPTSDQIDNFISLMKFVKNKPEDTEVTLLLGGEDYQYTHEFDRYENYNYENSAIIAECLIAQLYLFKVADHFNNFLISNSGVNSDFLNYINVEESDLETLCKGVNMEFEKRPQNFRLRLDEKNELNQYTGQSPLIMDSNALFMWPLKDGIIQVYNGEEERVIRQTKTTVNCNAQVGNSYVRLLARDVYRGFVPITDAIGESLF